MRLEREVRHCSGRRDRAARVCAWRQRSKSFRRGDACVALQPPPCVSKEGEAIPHPYGDLLNS
jgi:hypothetical protein